ncbi:acyl-CoA dehydrogenase family protein [Actinokineospora guangxiensis]|uniref:Acyl-CoA dehydrogenase family protein n=1 Tax=Actinokineospora guangxiensis TaxID=1490288 RepID=A0ABW0EV41_9PSEU
MAHVLSKPGQVDDVSSEELVQRAADLVPLLRANAREADRTRRIPQENLDALDDSGLLKTTRPAQYGGLEVDARTRSRIMSELARGCGSTGWVATLYLDGNFILGLYPDDVQDEVFADPHVRCTATLIPRGTAERDGSGFRVSGRWPFNSGSLHAQWVAEPAVVELEPGKPEVCFFLMRYSELTILDDWHVSGLRGTGSNTVVGENVFVPEQRMLRLAEAKVGNSHRSSANKDKSFYRTPPLSFLFTSGGSTMPGLARAAQELLLAELPARGPVAYTGYERRGEAPFTHLQVAEASLKIRSGEQLLTEALDILQDRADRGAPYSVEKQAELWGMISYCTRTFAEAIEILRIAAGAHGIFDSEQIQLVCQNAQALLTHAVMMPTTGMEHYGRALCGQGPSTPWL